MGYKVVYTIRNSGRENEVYWAKDKSEARTYAEMVVKNHGDKYAVCLKSDDGSFLEHLTR